MNISLVNLKKKLVFWWHPGNYCLTYSFTIHSLLLSLLYMKKILLNVCDFSKIYQNCCYNYFLFILETEEKNQNETMRTPVNLGYSVGSSTKKLGKGVTNSFWMCPVKSRRSGRSRIPGRFAECLKF